MILASTMGVDYGLPHAGANLMNWKIAIEYDVHTAFQMLEALIPVLKLGQR